MEYKANVTVPKMIPLEELADDNKEWVLEEISGPHGRVSLKCDRPLIFGRSVRNCNMVFPEETAGISRLHCEIVPKAEGLLLKDLNSSYGTFLENGSRVYEGSPVLLKKGDVFYLASKENMFKVR